MQAEALQTASYREKQQHRSTEYTQVEVDGARRFEEPVFSDMEALGELEESAAL